MGHNYEHGITPTHDTDLFVRDIRMVLGMLLICDLTEIGVSIYVA